MAVHRERGGFTLIELLVALVISGILVVIIFDLLLGQGRFARRQTAREEVQQNARAAVEVITSELRGVGTRGIVEATSSKITFYSPRAWGIVCDADGGNLTALFPSGVSHAFMNGAGATDALAILPTGKSEDEDADAADGWEFIAATDETRSQLGTAVDLCNERLSPSSLSVPSNWRESRARFFTGISLPVGTVIQPTDRVYVYEVVKYAVGKSAPGNEYWIRRNSGPALQMHPMAGPVPGTGGLVFQYFDDDGNDITAALDATAGDVAAHAEQTGLIARIGVAVSMQSSARVLAGEPDRDHVSAVVYLRNRRS